MRMRYLYAWYNFLVFSWFFNLLEVIISMVVFDFWLHISHPSYGVNLENNNCSWNMEINVNCLFIWLVFTCCPALI
jgi:hypothetical protein